MNSAVILPIIFLFHPLLACLLAGWLAGWLACLLAYILLITKSLLTLLDRLLDDTRAVGAFAN
jgi:hypothetical protein